MDPAQRIALSVTRPRCAYCHDDVLPEEPKLGCSACMAWEHTACAAELDGRCAACAATLPGVVTAPRPIEAPSVPASPEVASRIAARWDRGSRASEVSARSAALAEWLRGCASSLARVAVRARHVLLAVVLSLLVAACVSTDALEAVALIEVVCAALLVVILSARSLHQTTLRRRRTRPPLPGRRLEPAGEASLAKLDPKPTAKRPLAKLDPEPLAKLDPGPLAKLDPEPLAKLDPTSDAGG